MIGRWSASHSSGKIKRQHLSSTRLLQQARISLLRGLALEGLEAETRTEGLLAQAQASFLLGEIDTAQHQAHEALEEANHYEQTWLLACIQRFLGTILAVQGRHKKAKTHFTRSLETLKERGMRLEYARTLRDFGEAILQRIHPSDDDFVVATANLHEARQIFEECGASLDLELTERVLVVYASPAPAAHKRD